MHVDKITQIIAHFAGQFQISDEQSRLKEIYEQFVAGREAHEEPTALPDTDPGFSIQYQHSDFAPEIRHVPVPPELHPGPPHLHIPLVPVYAPPLPPLELADATGWRPMASQSGGGSSAQPLVLEPPGSVAVIIHQVARLTDNDYVGAGGHGLKFAPPEADDAILAELVEAVAALSPIDDLSLMSSDGAGFITTAAGRLDALGEQGEDIQTVVKADRIDGVYVNGALAEDAPKLKEHSDLLFKDEEDTDAEDHPSHQTGQGQLVDDVWVELTAGSNALVNSTTITNSWTNSTVLAVVGDSSKLNAIVQVNAHSDVDSLGDTLAGWNAGGDALFGQFNLAMFQHLETERATAPLAPDQIGKFPQSWNVTEVTGNLTVMNWVEQYAFVTDKDVAVLSSSGVKTTVGAGENMAINDVSLLELGKFYDLIVVGGNVYDANIIQQYNLLLDNDLVGAVDGFQTTGQTGFSTGSNLLWNQAAIVEVGGNAMPELMPEHYLSTANSLAGGKNRIDGGVLKDSAFEGLGSLKVLYVSGDIINLNAIKQTNILGDSDQVALAMNQFTPRADADWTISTGSNELVNFATITDIDAFEKTYVGGQSYTDEVLFQSGLVSDEPGLVVQNSDALVTELVAFLDDDATPTPDDYGVMISPTAEHITHDNMLG